MGHVHVDALVKGTKTQRTIRFMVDTGASFAVLPRALADDLGVLLFPDPVPVSLADGTRRDVHAGLLVIELQGRSAPMTTLILHDGEEATPLLGVETLEALGFKVDPTTGTIEPTRARAVMLVGIRTGRAR